MSIDDVVYLLPRLIIVALLVIGAGWLFLFYDGWKSRRYVSLLGKWAAMYGVRLVSADQCSRHDTSFERGEEWQYKFYHLIVQDGQGRQRSGYARLCSNWQWGVQPDCIEVRWE